MFSRLFVLVAVLVAAPVCALGAGGTPPSPYGDDKQGVYDTLSQCWVWDHGSTGKIVGAGYQFITDSRCDGKPLEGKAVIHWRRDRRNGEIWDGTFSNGRFTGQATLQLPEGEAETPYVDGLRNGPAHIMAAGGARGELNFKDDLKDGPDTWTYSDGTREESVYQKGKPVGLWITRFRDGSRMEQRVVEGEDPWPATYFTASGEQLNGKYVPPRKDSARRPRVSLPRGLVLKTGVMSITIGMMVGEDGKVHDPQLAQSSGYLQIDQTVLNQIAHWPFIPATLDGKPIASMVLFRQVFRVDE